MKKLRKPSSYKLIGYYFDLQCAIKACMETFVLACLILEQRFFVEVAL